MANTYSLSQTSQRFIANGPGIISRQQPRHPGMSLTPFVERREAQQEALRFKGGCCPCPGGGLWVFACGNGKVEQTQQPRQMQDTKRSQPPTPVLYLQPPAATASQLPPSLASARSSRLSHSNQSHMSGKPGQSKPYEHSSYGQEHVVELPRPPQARLDRRVTTNTLPPTLRPDMPQYQRHGPRTPARSAPTRPPALS